VDAVSGFPYVASAVAVMSGVDSAAASKEKQKGEEAEQGRQDTHSTATG
jgi:hypothetical protein